MNQKLTANATVVLGIEDACALAGEGWAAAIAPNRLTAEGIATALDLTAAPVVSVSAVIGALPSEATDPLQLEAGAREVRLSDGTTAPFDGAWLD